MTATANHIANHLNTIAHIKGNEVLEDSPRTTSAIVRLSNGEAFGYKFRRDIQDGTANLEHNIGGSSVTEYAASGTHAATILAAALRDHYTPVKPV